MTNIFYYRNLTMKTFAFNIVLAALMLPPATMEAARKKDFDFATYGSNKTTVSWAKKIQQGYNFRIWMSNMIVMGKQAFDDGNPPPTCGDIGIGCEYPLGACNEHLFGAGPWIGGIQDGVRKVTESYNGDFGYGFTLPERKDTLRDKIWQTSTSDTAFDASATGYYKRPMNLRNIDDDGDGKIDEDDLDGLDNDHDWVRATDDIGADGVPDSMETGCKGGYDPVRNPDPAYDNYIPTKYDSCHPNPDGTLPLMRDKDRYTEKNGLADHGEPHVDEDYAAISDHDIYVGATDTFRFPTYPTSVHNPLKIKVFQKSYAWQGKFADGILPMEYIYVNIGKKTIYNCYVAFFADIDLGPVNIGDYYKHDYAAYIKNLRTAYIHNAIDRGSTPLGITVLAAPRPLSELKYIFKWFDFTTKPGPGIRDSLLYAWMSGEAFPSLLIDPDQPIINPSDTRFFFSFGPFDTLKTGDSLKIDVAFVTGYCVDDCPGSLVDNAQSAIKLYKKGWRPPTVPPSPPLKITEGFKKVTLEWGSHLLANPNDMNTNPALVWDDSNKIAGSFPDTSWRRINPPPGHVSGGRIFEGYRLYRSEDPAGSEKTFTLMKQFDIPDDNYGYNTGLDTVFVDSNLVRGKTYWYAVTSYGLPDISVLEIPDSTGHITYDTLSSDNIESSLITSRQRVDLTFSKSDHLGDVLVVPNPYRVDRDYTFENGGWEGRARDWTENNRLVKFIHLPKDCTIRIFTLAGDVVATLNNIGFESQGKPAGELDWNLLSESNRALASGTYVFTVESALGRQIGKFVLIR